MNLEADGVDDTVGTINDIINHHCTKRIVVIESNRLRVSSDAFVNNGALIGLYGIQTYNIY